MMSRCMVLSDTHFGHKNILKYRGEFSSIEEHDQTIMEGIRTLTKRDTLWLMGDCFFTMDSLGFLREISAIVQQVHWILGNHDTDNSVRQQVVRQAINEDLVSKVGTLFKYGKGDNKYWLSHHPVHPLELRGKDNIHGHVHRETILDDRYLNVCCENTRYTPLNIQDLNTKTNRQKLLVAYGE